MIVSMQEQWNQLKRKLLQDGGDYVVRPASEPDIDLLVKRGKERQGKVTQIEGKTGECHKNVARAWRRGEGDVVTGYALSKDGGWRQHSWLEKGKEIKETTDRKRELYWGAEVTDPKAWSDRQQRSVRWWQPVGWILVLALFAFTVWWVLSGAPLPEVGK